MCATNKLYFVYKTTNMINGKIYIGVHGTHNLQDGYIGCGVTSQKNAIHRRKRKDTSPFVNAVVKHGYENFQTKPLQFFDTISDAFEVEELIVDADFVRSTATYNTALGGAYPQKIVTATQEQEKKIKNLFVFNTTVPVIAKELNISLRMVRRVLKGFRYSRRYRMASLRIKFGGCIRDIREAYESNKGTKYLFKTYNLYWNSLRDLVEFYNWTVKVQQWVGIKGGSIKIIPDLIQFSKDEGLFLSGIMSQVNGESASYKGWRFIKKEDYDSGNYTIRPKVSDKYKGLKFINPSGDIEEVTTNLTDFCKNRGLIPSCIYQLWSGRMKQHKGYKLYIT